MTTGRFFTATVAGGVTLFVVGFLLWGLLATDFYEAHVGTATGVTKEPMEWAYLVLGQLFWAALLAHVIGTWAKVSGFGPGLKIGLVFGILVSFAIGLTQYSMSNLMDLSGTLVDPLLTGVWAGLGGGVIGLVLGCCQSEPAG